MTHPWPAFNAFLNGSCACLLGAGLFFIKSKNPRAHQWAMAGAVLVSAVFLASYLAYHVRAGTTRYPGTGFLRSLYLGVLATHTLLAAAIPALVGITYFHAFRKRWKRHSRWARWTWPLWMYVSVTGVAIYLMLYQLVPPASSRETAPSALAEAFPHLRFELPLFLVSPKDGTDRIFVAEQDGRVWWFENDRETTARRLALDISGKVRRVHNEEGLLGMAFHPRFRENGQVYLQYSASSPRRNVISRFAMDGTREKIDPSSEKVILEIGQPYGNHNGGMLAFGPDGFLYIGLGDGGAAGDPHGNAQNKETLLGKILRIDVDRQSNDLAYAVPPDNPFAEEKGSRGEIWAMGLRNPWRFSFDRKTGELWAGDVGQDSWEEIDLISRGGNYGWNIREGKHPFRGGAAMRFIDPVLEHGREEAQSITGGYVYRGRMNPGLAGDYIYGDFMTGNIWALHGAQSENPMTRRLVVGELISSFGEDEAGEIYVCSFNGRIYKLTAGAK